MTPGRDSVRLRRKAVELSIPCITAVDTAASLVDCLRSEHSLANIPLVDIATLYRGKVSPETRIKLVLYSACRNGGRCICAGCTELNTVRVQ